MKRSLLFLIVMLAGCAWLGEQVDYAALCNADPACLADAKSKAGLVGTVTGAFYPPIAGAATAAALYLALWWGGRKKKAGK